MSRPFGRVALAAAALCLLLSAGASAATTDPASTALDIIPSGQLGSVPVPAGADRQARMYDALTPRFDDVTSADLQRDFKSERFGTKGQCPCTVEKVPRSGIRLVRDRFGVPHITAQSDDALTWAAGWVMAEDRGLLLEEARYDARLAAIDAPNLTAIALVSAVRTFVPSPQTETEVARQTRAIRGAGARGDQLPFQDLTQGRVRSPESFTRAFLRSPQTFNAFYADDRHIAEVTTGLLPVRAADVDPGLPTNGDGNREWRGFLAAARHPRQIDPSSGRIVNWNNKVARGFEAADDAWNYGLSHRVDLLDRNLDKRTKHSLTSVVGAMNAAATQDLRVIDLVPALSAALRGAEAPTPRAAEMLRLLRTWRDRGGSRLDREGDGRIDSPGAAIIDAAWPRIADAVMGPILGPQLDELATLEPRYDQPPGGQSGGWHSYVLKDLRDQFGPRTAAPFRVRYCGAGDADACRTALWAALDAAGAESQAAQGANPSVWRADATKERITFVPGLLETTLRDTNRPTGIQQVISFKGHRATP